ncbi:helix-turn-helix transcriptional regulator [Microbacterium terregens]|uniref:AAA family ATPase n=1 Tax=Microbacterium terregens TaxID=69363 RepID=A0ABV5SWB1_9MICO
MLVGRQAEQQAIGRLTAAARLGMSGALVVVGEAGAGKTAVLEDTVDGLEDMRVLRATGVESERDIPFGTLLQLARPALGLLEEIPPVQAAALSAALALPATPADSRPGAHDRFTIGAALLSLVCRYAEDGPVAVVVDDLHLADRPSANALVFAARRLAADPVAVVFGVRTPEGDDIAAGLPSLPLPGLTIAAARALVSRARGHPLGEEQLQRLHTATAGNPLALLELSAADREVVESAETGLPLRVPRAVAEAFGRRLASLEPECRSVLLVAAVCGSELRLITDVCGALGLDLARIDEAEDLGLVTVRGAEVEFRHPLLRSAAYSAAPAQDRRAAHRAAADATADADRRAWHLAEATWHPDAGVADLLAAAGARAVARAAYAVGSGAFERAAHLSADDDERAARLLHAADTAWTAGMRDRALALLDQHGRATESTADRTVAPTAMRALELRAAIAARSGSLREALEILLTAADLSPRADDTAILLADAVHAAYYLGDARTASTLADRLSGLRAAVSEPRARALGLMATGMAKVLSGRGGAADIRAAVPLLETDAELLRDPRRLSWLMLAPLYLRDATSGARLRALVDEVRAAAGIGALPAVLFHVARDQAATEAWTRAEANYTESIRLAADTGQTTELAMSLAGLCWLESRAGKADAARAHATEAAALCADRDIHIGEAWVAFALGDLALSLGDADRAVEHLSALTILLDRLGLQDVDLSPAPELADALLRLGRRADAVALSHRYRDDAVRKGQPWARARADRACGQAGGEDEVDEWFSAALGWHDQTLDRFESARTRLAYGERLRRAGRRVDARVQLRRALEDFSDLGASIWGERAAAELTATGEHVRTTAVNAVAALTPQELQVSVMLAEGRTTREAAAALFLSPKTIEYHLRKVYTKLGIGSRAELAEQLAPLRPRDRRDATRPG